MPNLLQLNQLIEYVNVGQKNAEAIVNLVLNEFFKKENVSHETWTQKRLTAEHEYLTAKYKARSEAGRKGGLAKSDNASSKMVAPIPIPNPIPNKELCNLHV